MTTRLRHGITGVGVLALVSVITAGGLGIAATGRSSVARVAADSVPAGWLVAGSRPQDYSMRLDRSVMRAGKPSATIEAIALQPSGFGTLMQQIAADGYRGRRVRLSGDVRVREVPQWAALWMRVDGPGGEVLGFDNAQDRAAHGTADWQHFDIVLDVPQKADVIAFGTLLAGGGTVWVNGLKFEEVPLTVAVTGRPMQGASRGPAVPVNLDFSARD